MEWTSRKRSASAFKTRTNVENCVFVASISIEQRRKRNSRAAADGQRLGEEQQLDGDRTERGPETHRVAPNGKGRAPAVIAGRPLNHQAKGENGVSLRKREEAAAPESSQLSRRNATSHHVGPSSTQRDYPPTKDEVTAVSEKDPARFKGILIPVLFPAPCEYRNR